MCGIIAVRRFDGRPVDQGALVRMRDTMHHRGPDDAGIYVDGAVGLGHRRLSIVDLSPSGHQPMSNEDGTIWLTFNGEIYNYVELRRRLEPRHRFRSQTDSEVIIHLYEEMGERCVEEFNGMFAFVIWDSRKRQLFGARDRFGIKPLYYFADHRQFVCASEIKAIVADEHIRAEPDHEGIADYLFAGAPLADRTFFKGVHQLPPGHTLTVNDRGTRVSEYWDLTYRYDNSAAPTEIVHELSELLDDAVRIHCRSDAPLGSHLSGGLDSSTVACFASRHVDPLRTFSIRFDAGGVFDETSYARAVSYSIDSRYTESTAQGGLLAQIYPRLMWHMDQPAAGGADGGFSYYAAASLASRHVKVALTGHGGDEIFAGYPAQFETAFGSTAMFSSFGGASGDQSLSARIRRVLLTEGGSGIVRRLANRLKSSGSASPEETWLAFHCGEEPGEDPSLHPDFVSSLGGYSPKEAYLKPFRAAPTDRMLDRCLYHDLRVYLPQLLHKEDRASMAVSIESRLPLLDSRVVTFMSGLEPEQKLPELRPKELLRRAVAGVVPTVVRERRDKVGFAVPVQQWVSGELRSMVTDLIDSPRFLDRGVFDPDLVRNAPLSPSEQLKLINVELWFRLFIDRDPAWLERAETPLERHPAPMIDRDEASLRVGSSGETETRSNGRSRVGASMEFLGLSAPGKREVIQDRFGGLGPAPDIDEALSAVVGWLERAQDLSASHDGGVATYFSLESGWAASYPETTGYIVPTMVAYGRHLGSDRYAERARRMLDWLVSIQFEDGAFPGGIIGADPVVPVTFNTGQILLGLAEGAREFGGEYRTAMRRAADWLADTQDRDGCWRAFPSPFAAQGEKTYDTHVAWGLFEAERVEAGRGYAEAAERNVRWALTHQRENGWFSNCCLDTPEVPLTHTLGYALRGCLEAYRFTGDATYLEASRRAAFGLRSAMDSDGFLPGRLDDRWRGVVSWSCLTGTVQIAHCWLLLGDILGDGDLQEAGRRGNRYVRRTIRLRGPDGIRGGVKGSFPVGGDYGRYRFLNWAAKFFVDSHLYEMMSGRSTSTQGLPTHV